MKVKNNVKFEQIYVISCTEVDNRNATEASMLKNILITMDFTRGITNDLNLRSSIF